MLRYLLSVLILSGLSMTVIGQVPAKEEPTELIKKIAAALDDHYSGKEFLGMSEMDVFRRLGKPTSQKPDVWEYSGGLREGTSFIMVRVVIFKDGKVVSAEQRPRSLGCVYWAPRKR